MVYNKACIAAKGGRNACAFSKMQRRPRVLSAAAYAERAAVYVFGVKSRFVVKLLWVGMIFLGSQTTLGLAWDLADTINGLISED